MRTWTEIAKIETKTVQERMLCEFPKILSVLVFQKLKMVVCRGPLRYWPGEGLEPIPNECPFIGYPAECCVRDPLPGLQGPRISSIKTDAVCPLVDGRFDPLTVIFSMFDKSPEADFHHQPVLPIKAARAVWIWWMRLYHKHHLMAYNRMMSAGTPL